MRQTTHRETDYDRYIRTAELLACQKPVEQLATHDERLFQMTHQACELWMKLVEFEMLHVCALLDGDELLEAARILGRVRDIMRVLTESFPLLEHILPVDFHVVRTQLGRGSGSESPGFRRLLTLPQDVWPHFTAMMERRGKTVLDVHRAPRQNFEELGIIEGLMEYDEQFQKLRYVHFALARRVLGTKVMSLKNIPVNSLSPGGNEPLFPELWQAVDALTLEHPPQQAYEHPPRQA